jgi:hypothetical protein
MRVCVPVTTVDESTLAGDAPRVSPCHADPSSGVQFSCSPRSRSSRA